MSSSTQLLALPFLPARAEDRPHLEIFEERSPPGDLARCADLVKKVQAGDGRAFEELARLLEPRRRALIHRVLRSWGLGSTCFKDAEQEALLMTFQAAQDFDFERAASERCSFPTFAWELIGREVSNVARTEHRHGRHYEHSAKSTDALEEGGRSKRRGTDPVDEAARRERECRLEKFFARRPAKMRAFWDLLVAKKKLPEIVRELGITKRQAKRWKERLKKELPKEIKPYWD